MRLTITLLVALLLIPLGSAAEAASITRTVKVTKTITVRTVTKRTIIRTVTHKALHSPIYRARTVVLVRRFHPESCFLTPDLVVALNALGPYCDSPRAWRRIVVR
jgi:carbohydrate-binding DOMON domain-containing protein